MGPMILKAQSIKEDSWLNEEKYDAFRQAWDYASTQTRAIPAMAHMTPEQGWWLLEALQRGLERSKDL